MNKKTVNYTDEPLGEVKIIKDFLPSPKELAIKNNTVRVTLLLSETSVNYFKLEAKKNNARYQTMIRQLIDNYVEHYTNDALHK